MNVLLTCVGRCSALLNGFKAVLNGRGRVLACACSADAPALSDADAGFVVPHVSEPSYVSALLGLCAKHQVGLLVPALEPELLLLATHRARFAALGTIVVVSSPETIDTCYDKLRAGRFLSGIGVAVPQTYATLAATRAALSRGDLHFPLMVKPRWGVHSLATSVCEDGDELELADKIARKQIARSLLASISGTDPEHAVLFQEHLSGTEYGLEVVNDLQGNHVCTFVKRKLRMRAGETDRAVTVEDSPLELLGSRIGRELGHVGVLGCDAFVTEQGTYLIDLNPGLGSDYYFSHLAGANLPAALVAWARGEAPDQGWLEVAPHVASSRCESFVRLRRPPQDDPCGSGPRPALAPLPAAHP